MYDDFWYDEQEPLPYEEEINALVLSIREGIRSEVIEELEELRKENEELRPIKANWNKLKSDYEKKTRELERDYEKKQTDLKRGTLAKLIEDSGTSFWDIAYRSEKKEKCDKCDEYRLIKFKSPSGKDCSEYCECNIEQHHYEPVECTLYRIQKENSRYTSENKFTFYYKYRKYRDGDEELRYVANSFCGDTDEPRVKRADKGMVRSEADFEKYERYEDLFATQELAQKYCDLLNKGEIK